MNSVKEQITKALRSPGNENVKLHFGDMSVLLIRKRTLPPPPEEEPFDYPEVGGPDGGWLV